MTQEIYKHDAYVFEFEAKVVSVDSENIVLDSTAFYPGGGGQVCDTGTISGHAVKEVFRKGKDIIHAVPKHNLSEGNMVWCSVDWERRYDLMKGHTAEHLLFGSLQRAVPELRIVKISISPESKYVIVDRDIDWNDVKDAVSFANKVISDNLTIRKIVMKRDDPDLENVRMDIDKIKTEEITVVEIGNVDSAACSGIHVMETEELGGILVDRKVSAGKDGTAIHFRIGNDAVDTSMELANTCLRTCEVLGTKPEDLVNASNNMKEQLETMRKGMKDLILTSVSSLRGIDMNGTSVYSATYPNADSRIFTEACEKFRKNGSVVILISSGTSLNVFLSSGSEKVDCGRILGDTVKRFNGRGGGRKEYAQGGCPDPMDSERLLKELENAVRSVLTG